MERNGNYQKRIPYGKVMITTKQAAEKWEVTHKTVLTWIARGKIPEAQKLGRDWLIPADTTKPIDKRYVDEPIRNRRKNK